MSRAAIAALLLRNAKACEEAQYPTCRCACGGAYHGRKHSEEWLHQVIEERSLEEWETLLEEQLAEYADLGQPDLFAVQTNARSNT